jgi:hypothetical protein
VSVYRGPASGAEIRAALAPAVAWNLAALATEPIDDTSTGKLLEGVAAAFAQFDNDVRSDRTRAGMTKAALVRIERHSGQLEELDVEGILAFAERVLPRAADLWVQASLEQRQRFQHLFFPDGIAFDAKGFIGTGGTAPAFNYLWGIRTGNEGLVDQREWNPRAFSATRRVVTGRWRRRAPETADPRAARRKSARR